MSNQGAKRWVGVATLDWTASGLTDVYPSDLPESWQLTWYANQVMAIVLPANRWLLADADVVTQWCSQVQHNFWFYLYCDDASQFEAAVRVANVFTQQFAGIVMAEGVTVPAIESSVTVLCVGQQVCWYAAPNLRQGRKVITDWLHGFDGDHGLILIAPTLAQEIQPVQTLLTLLGE